MDSSFSMDKARIHCQTREKTPSGLSDPKAGYCCDEKPNRFDFQLHKHGAKCMSENE